MGNNLVVSTGAAGQVGNEVDQFQSYGSQAIEAARDALNEMLTVVHLPQSVAKPGNTNTQVTYSPPTTFDTWNFSFSPPDWGVEKPGLKDVVVDDVRKFTGRAPNKVYPSVPTQPNPIMPTAPGDSPSIGDIVIPEPPVLDDIADPKEWAISLPTAPVIDIPPFSAQRPDGGNLTKPSNDFSWSEDPYTSETLDCVIARISDFCEGGVGIPDAVWEAIWTKDNDRENRAGTKLITEVNEEWSSRGFQLPQGVQVAQIQEIQQGLQSTAAGRSRDIAIRESDLAIENLRFAVQQGIALESLRGSWYQATQQRLLEAARFSSEFAVSVFNAEIAFYNAQVQMYLADIAVYKAEIEAELARLEVYKTELEGQKIIGELNMQQVQIYTAKVNALGVEIELYNAILAGVKTTVEVDALRIDGYRAEVQAYSARIDAINSEYNGYATAMQGAKIEVDMYSANVNAYATTVQAYSAEVDASAKKAGAEVAVEQYKLEAYKVQILGYTAELDGRVKELQAAVSEYDAGVKGFAAELESKKTDIQAQSANLQSDLSLAQQTTQVNIANAESNAKTALAEADIVQKSLDSIAKVNGAYAGSALAAVHVGMTIGDSANNSASA